MRRLPARAGALLAAVLILAGCGGDGDSSSDVGLNPDPTASSSLAQPVDECDTPYLTVVNPGQLTVGATSVDVEPFFIDGTPSSGEGFEAALAYAVADHLGFGPADVAWVDAPTLGSADEPRVDFVIGQVTASSLPPEQGASAPYLAPVSGEPYVLAFVASNPLLTCVDEALIALGVSGAADELARTWLAGTELGSARVGATAGVS